MTTAVRYREDPVKSHDVRDAGRSVQRSALIAGLGILMIAALSVFANFVVLERLVTPGDAATTASDVLASKALFQWGIAGWLLIAVLDVVVAWALFRVFRPVGRRVAMVGAWSRAVYGAVLIGAVSQLIQGLGLLGGSTAPSTSAQLQALHKMESFTDIWNFGLVLFGVHLLLVGYLAYRSGYLPKLVGTVVAIAGFGYLFDAAARVVVDDPSFSLSVITGLGEFVLGVWLVSKAHRISVPQSMQTDDSRATQTLPRV